MSALRFMTLTAILIALLYPERADAQTSCAPRIELGKAYLSGVINLKRYWTATVNVDASKCAASTGLFSIRFLRWSESGPDLEFTEPFIWRRGEGKVRVEFWADEAVGAYNIADVATCQCRVP